MDLETLSNSIVDGSFSDGDIGYYVVDYGDYDIYHHGIKGQKWGIKNGPPYPLGEDNHSREEKKANWKISLGKGETVTKRKIKKSDAPRIILNKDDKKKRTHREKLIQKYVDAGYSYSNAEKRAYDRIKIEKAVAVTATITIGSALAVSIYRHYRNDIDKTLKIGTKIQNMTNDPDFKDFNALYGAYNEFDKNKYMGIYGNFLGNKAKKAGLENPRVYSRTLKTTKDIKVASDITGRKTLQEILDRNPSLYNKYADYLEEVATSMTRRLDGRGRGILRTGANNLRKGIVDKKAYDGFNIALTNHTAKDFDKYQRSFYEALKRKGYSAVGDVNDRKYTGFYTKAPTIVFDFEDIVTESIKEVDKLELLSSQAKAFGELGKDYVLDNYYIPISAISTFVINGLSNTNNKKDKVLIGNESQKNQNKRS